MKYVYVRPKQDTVQRKTENHQIHLCFSLQVLPPFLCAERSVLQCHGLLRPGEYAQVSVKAALLFFLVLVQGINRKPANWSNLTNTWINKAGSVIKKRSFSKPSHEKHYYFYLEGSSCILKRTLSSGQPMGVQSWLAFCHVSLVNWQTSSVRSLINAARLKQKVLFWM